MIILYKGWILLVYSLHHGLRRFPRFQRYCVIYTSCIQIKNIKSKEHYGSRER